MNVESESYTSHNEEETFELGRRFGARLRAGDVVALYGDLGAGKTEFIKGVCEYFSVQEIVSSPTFTIMNQYFGETPTGEDISIFHIDLYRIKGNNELEQIGFDDCVHTRDAIKLVEWPEKGESHLPWARYAVHIHFDEDDDSKRTIEIQFVQDEVHA